MLAVLFDTETTGLVENRSRQLDQQPSVIEFYGCLADLKTGKIKKEYGQLVKPPNPLSDLPEKRGGKTITEITGISNEMLEKAPPFAKVASKVFDFVEKAPVLIAHNLTFDRDMLEIEAERLKRKLKLPKQSICTVEQTIHLKGHRLTLSNLYELLFKERFAGAHRAKGDVIPLLRCSVELFKRGII